MTLAETRCSDITSAVNFLDMSDLDRYSLSSRVKRVDGTVEVYIHPFYEETSLSEQITSLDSLAVTYDLERRKHLRRSVSQTNLPFFVFEHDRQTLFGVNCVEKLYQHADALVNPYYVVLTQDYNPSPYYSSDSRSDSWDRFASDLRSCCVKKVILKGRNYFNTQLRLSDDTVPLSESDILFIERFKEELAIEDGLIDFPRGCIGIAVRELVVRNIAVELSGLLYPEVPRRLQFSW